MDEVLERAFIKNPLLQQKKSLKKKKSREKTSEKNKKN
jgi:hypothetical protein